ncbi:Protein mak11 [Vermiconidia calcicola]|uniref:Protein mak11 n=1 Tax=Vermiconidia calcicola TaxID=1690605 RepID=A0ACC3MPU9_9PEZI|nr:Protein mak11 [Vermiconidia calcicola]
MSTATLKRKRVDVSTKPTQPKKTVKTGRVNFDNSLSPAAGPEPQTETAAQRYAPPKSLITTSHPEAIAVQIVTGSYDRVLHGVCAEIPLEALVQPTTPENTTNGTDKTASTSKALTFSDTFLFAAHTASIRCLALSPPTDADKRILATGSSDERINLYNLSTAPPSSSKPRTLTPRPSLLSSTSSTAENPRNRSLGNLIHHDRPVTRLSFPSKSKLFSAAEDNAIAISRTRDWTVLSSIKAPIPKPQGRPSGDTAGPGEVPAGVNDFAIHPSQKLMLSVGRGERCMRLWNLMTGKKAGVLNFDRDLLMQVGEGRYSSGEGRRVLWNDGGEMYVVGFERGAVVFGIDSKPKAIIRPPPSTKLHQMRFLLPASASATDESVLRKDILAMSTEDGRILLYNLAEFLSETGEPDGPQQQNKLPNLPCLAQLGGQAAGITSRIKDFDVVQLRSKASDTETSVLIVAGSSDGAIRLFTVSKSDLAAAPQLEGNDEVVANREEVADNSKQQTAKQVGNLIGTLETGNRITCIGAFLMDGKVTGENAAAGEINAEEDMLSDEVESEDDVVGAQI